MSETGAQSGFVPPLVDGYSSLPFVEAQTISAEVTTIPPPEESKQMENGANDTPQLVNDQKEGGVVLLHHRVLPWGESVLHTTDSLPGYEREIAQIRAGPTFARRLIIQTQRILHPVFPGTAA